MCARLRSGQPWRTSALIFTVFHSVSSTGIGAALPEARSRGGCERLPGALRRSAGHRLLLSSTSSNCSLRGVVRCVCGGIAAAKSCFFHLGGRAGPRHTPRRYQVPWCGCFGGIFMLCYMVPWPKSKTQHDSSVCDLPPPMHHHDGAAHPSAEVAAPRRHRPCLASPPPSPWLPTARHADGQLSRPSSRSLAASRSLRGLAGCSRRRSSRAS